jgi:hypothetical protein
MFTRGRACLVAAGVVLGSASIASAQTASASTPTFTRDISPILQQKCETCHRKNSIAPMSLVTYEEVRPWVRSIRARVETHQMPPWHLDRNVGIQQFKNDRSLSDQQIATLLRWIDEGTPRGDPKDAPAPLVWPDEQGWNYAKQFGQSAPDLVIRSGEYTQKMGAQDTWWRNTVDTGLTEFRWVRAIEIRPVNVKGRKVIHHVLIYLQQDEKTAPVEFRDPEIDANDPMVTGAIVRSYFMEWSVGKQGEQLRANAGKLLLPGSRVQFEIHFSSSNEDVTTQAEMGIYFYPKGETPHYRTSLAFYGVDREGSTGIDLPPNQVTVSEGYTVMRRPGRLESFQPHMHLRGKAMSIEAILPDGSKQMLSYVPDFNFNWHNSYVYADNAAPLLPKGTVLHITAWHDNTVAKKSNPDPNQWVGFGDRTVDEMAHAWLNITFMTDADFKREQDARAAATKTVAAR